MRYLLPLLPLLTGCVVSGSRSTTAAFLGHERPSAAQIDARVVEAGWTVTGIDPIFEVRGGELAGTKYRLARLDEGGEATLVVLSNARGEHSVVIEADEHLRNASMFAMIEQLEVAFEAAQPSPR